MIKETFNGYDEHKEQYYVFLNESKPVDPYLLLYGNQIKKDGWGVFLNLKNKLVDVCEELRNKKSLKKTTFNPLKTL